MTFTMAPGIHRQRSQRHMVLRAVRLDLPPDVAAAVGLISKKTGIPAAEIIIDILRDNLGSAQLCQLQIPQREAAE